MRLRPSVTWKTYRRGRVGTELPVVPCTAADFPPEAAARLEAYVAPLLADGFVHALDCGPRDAAATVINHCRVLAHPTEQIRAWVMDLESEHAINTVVELATRLPDGTIVGTLNPVTPPIFDRPPWIKAELLPGAPAEALLILHRARVAELAVPPAPPWDEDPLTTAQQENDAVLAYQAERGVLAAKDGDYRYTGRGAVRSVHRVANAEPTD
jgi:hypothetical protein